MARPLRIEYSGAFYHITSRGNEIRDKYLRGKKADRNLPALAELKKIPIEEIINEVEVVFSGDKGLWKKAAIYL